MKTPVTLAKDGVTIHLYVQPGASKSSWCGVLGDALKLKVAARPVEGEANKEVCAYIAAFLAVPKSAVSIAHGHTGRKKLVHVAGDGPLLLEKLRAVSGVRDI